MMSRFKEYPSGQGEGAYKAFQFPIGGKARER